MALEGWMTRALSRVLGSRAVLGAVGTRTLDRPAVFDADEAGVTGVKWFGHDQTVSFERLDALGALPEKFRDRPGSVETPGWSVLDCRDCQLAGPLGLTFLPDGRVLLENAIGWNKRVAVSAGRTVLDGTLPVRCEGSARRTMKTAVSLVGPWTDNYYHWHLDYLVRLAPLSAYTEATGLRPPLLLPPKTSGWMQEALSLVGYDGDWCVWDGRRTNIDRLVVPMLPRETEGSAPNLTNHYYSLNPDAVRWLGHRMRSNATGAKSHAPDSGRLYVSRQGADSRRLVNLDAIAPVLDEYGFKRFRPEDHSVAEQVRTFADADVVLGIHGAGLTNLLFAEDATLIELFGEYVNPVFYALAAQTGMDYACASFEPRGDDLHVDSERLRDLLELANVDAGG